MSEELKLCPFCNQAARAVPDSEHATAYTLQHHSKGCPIDDLWDWYPDEAQAIAAWNTRAKPVVKALVWDELRQHKLGSGPYEVACNTAPVNPDAMWRVKYHGKVVCKKIKGVYRAIAWANAHNTRTILACLEGYDD